MITDQDMMVLYSKINTMRNRELHQKINLWMTVVLVQMSIGYLGFFLALAGGGYLK